MRRAWKMSEIKFVRENYLHMTYEEVGDKLGRTKGSVAAVIKHNDFDKKKAGWTEEKKNTLMRMVNEGRNSREIADEVGFSAYAVRCYMHSNNIKWKKHFRGWTKEEEDVVRENFGKKTYAEIGKLINRTKGAVRARVKSMGLGKPLIIRKTKG